MHDSCTKIQNAKCKVTFPAKIRYVYRILTAKPRETNKARGAGRRIKIKYVSENHAVWKWN